jgi:hypothetical protein
LVIIVITIRLRIKNLINTEQINEVDQLYSDLNLSTR